MAAKSGSMRQVASHFGVASSGVIRQLQKLEDQVQSKLFTRFADGVQLTPAGRILYRHIAELELSIEKALEEIDVIRGIACDQIRIAANAGISREFLIPHLARFAHLHPEIRYSLTSLNQDQAEDNMKARDADIFLLQGSVLGADEQSIFSSSVPCGAIFNKGHRFSGIDQITFADLHRERIIVNMTDTFQRAFAQRLTNVAPRDRSAIEVDSDEGALQMVQAGLGFQFRTPIGCCDLLNERKIGFVRVRDAEPVSQRLSLCLRPNSKVSRGTHLLLRSLSEGLSQSSFSRWFCDDTIVNNITRLNVADPASVRPIGKQAAHA